MQVLQALAKTFKFTFRYIDLISFNKVTDYLSLIYPPELKIKETTDNEKSVSCLELYTELASTQNVMTKKG